MRTRPLFAPLASTVLVVGAAFIATVVTTRCRSTQKPSDDVSEIAASPTQADVLLGWSPIVDELASFGCELLLEPHTIDLVDPTRSLPLIVQLPTIRAVVAFRESFGSELENLAELPQLDSLLFRRCELPGSLAFLQQLSRLRDLGIASSNLTDEHLENVQLAMPLRTLDLSYNGGISERGMASFLNLRFLARLDLTSTGVARLDFLDGMSELEELFLGQTKVTDEDMRFLIGHANLRSLELFNTNITDSAIDAIASIESLQRLDIRYTEVSKDAIQRFRPSVAVIRE
jgi:Leucine-rich repeat (LRR) protein